jgi:predicted SAM-dependent methyltransferase
MSIKRRLAPVRDAVYDRVLSPAKRRRFLADFERARAAGRVKVNIGSGGKPLPGWINCDIVWRGESYLDATKPWPVPAGSVDVIYADNVIEHVPLAAGRQVFRHAFDALVPGGVFRLATPDVESVARQYLENGELAQLGLERNREKGRDFIYPVQLLYRVYVGAKHYLGFCYDYHALSTEMQNAGFEVTRVKAGVSEHPDLVGLEARMHPAEEATTLIVEGRKP